MSALVVLIVANCSLSTPVWLCDAQTLTGIDARLLHAICLVESGCRQHVTNHSDGGSPSYGPMQIKLTTARYVGFTGTAEQLMQPGTNAHYAAKYLVKKLNRYKNILMAISAYNAGRAVDFNADYVEKVMKNYRRLAAQ